MELCVKEEEDKECFEVSLAKFLLLYVLQTKIKNI
jgi:hypothetical protein